MKQPKSFTLPSGWEWKSLGSCVRLINGRAYKQKELLSKGTPVLRIQNLNGGRNWYYSNLNLPEDKYCQDGDLLYAWSATFGPYIWRGERAIYHYHIWKVETFPTLDKLFCFYLLSWISAAVKLSAHGITMVHMTKAGMESWKIPLPPIAEQKRIAAILDKADSVRRKRKEAIALTEELLRSAFLEMFGDPVTNPKGWDIVPMKKVVAETQYGTAEKSNEVMEGLPVLRMNNITYSGEIDLDSLKWCQISPKDEEKFTVQRDDLLFNRTNSPELVGKTAVWRSDEKFAYAGYLIRVRFDQSRINSEYVSAFLNSAYGKKYLLEKAKPSINMSNFSASEFLKIPVPVPDMKVQRQFKEFSNSTREMSQRLSSELEGYDNLFNSLLQRAFRGEL